MPQCHSETSSSCPLGNIHLCVPARIDRTRRRTPLAFCVTPHTTAFGHIAWRRSLCVGVNALRDFVCTAANVPMRIMGHFISRVLQTLNCELTTDRIREGATMGVPSIGSGAAKRRAPPRKGALERARLSAKIVSSTDIETADAETCGEGGREGGLGKPPKRRQRVTQAVRVRMQHQAGGGVGRTRGQKKAGRIARYTAASADVKPIRSALGVRGVRSWVRARSWRRNA